MANKIPSILDTEQITAPFSAPPKNTGVSPDFDAVYASWQKQKTPETNTQLLSTIQPIIDTSLSAYGGTNVTPTLKSKARLMALKAMETYSPEKGNVKTHLLSQMQRLRRLSAQSQNIISLPEQVVLDFQKLSQAEVELTDALGREPTDDELADYTALSTRRIMKIRQFNQPIAEGTVSRPVDEESGGGEVASELPGQTRGMDAWLGFIYDDLGPTDKLIMDLTLGRNGKRKTNTADIARRLKMTPGAVSQRAAKIQVMIDKQKELGGF